MNFTGVAKHSPRNSNMRIIPFLILLISSSAHAMTVTALGDSTTAGIYDNSGEVYPYTKFLDENFNVNTSGIPGHTSENILKDIDYLFHVPPDAVILWIGQNDLNTHINHSVIMRNISMIINKLRENKIHQVIVIPAIWPDAYLYDGDHLKVKNIEIFRQLLKEFCEHWQIPYVMVDEIHSEDGIHPGRADYELIGGEINKILKNIEANIGQANAVSNS